MFKCVHKTIAIGVASLLLSSVSLVASEAKKNAIDGGMTYTRDKGMYSVYHINEQNTTGINYGRTPTANEIKAWDTDIKPDGTGLPDGKGSVEEGDELYEDNCAVCHGDFGAGGVGYPTLTGGDISSLKNQRTAPGMDAPKRTIGTYWPQASTLIWYIRDAMPYAHPKSLTDNELYAITAYLLATNDIKVDGKEMGDDFVLSKENFLKIKMPNRNGFYPNIDGKDGVENVRKFFQNPKNFGANTIRCMKDCKDDGAKVMRIGIEMKDVQPPYSTVRDLPKKKKASNHPGKEDYEKNCAICHSTDKMGAPDVGNKEAWAKVMKKGIDKVMLNATKGTGAMPPRGGNMDLTDEQIKNIISYMVDNSK
ncbi:MAG: c-type cytochrome [Sulfurovaceae bacterium]|nr:c-type cytochrome [Sulfurovaceae bacterium]